MTSFEFEDWDDGRLRINRQFADVLRHNALTTFRALMDDAVGEVAKNLLCERVTSRLDLTDASGFQHGFYIKRHQPVPWKEYVKPLLRLTRPILGAGNEWNAILNFHQAGINTMRPGARGRSRGRSFVTTQAIDGCDKLSDWMEHHFGNGNSGDGSQNNALKRRVIDEVAAMARRMHACGLHHQDFYLTHLLLPRENSGQGIHVIDLGRARRLHRLSNRWIVKDLAQLNYSARQFSDTDRRQFLQTYFGRPVRETDASFLHRIRRKTERIARHSRKNRL